MCSATPTPLKKRCVGVHVVSDVRICVCASYLTCYVKNMPSVYEPREYAMVDTREFFFFKCYVK